MSMYDQAYARAMRVWKQARQEGWLDEYLQGNTRGKKASKQAFSAGYIRAIVDIELVKEEVRNGQSHQQDASQHEASEVQPRNKPNLSQQNNKGEI